ncbi:hypothetical protein B0H10DRAFT_1967359 [Mycena sp. CBHHK59/15]|nr:hypothetical protein B0H10DRAFT_1967359 [Mycena sp. CBHHK59/15]
MTDDIPSNLPISSHGIASIRTSSPDPCPPVVDPPRIRARTLSISADEIRGCTTRLRRNSKERETRGESRCAASGGKIRVRRRSGGWLLEIQKIFGVVTDVSAFDQRSHGFRVQGFNFPQIQHKLLTGTKTMEGLSDALPQSWVGSDPTRPSYASDALEYHMRQTHSGSHASVFGPCGRIEYKAATMGRNLTHDQSMSAWTRYCGELQIKKSYEAAEDVHDFDMPQKPLNWWAGHKLYFAEFIH